MEVNLSWRDLLLLSVLLLRGTLLLHVLLLRDLLLLHVRLLLCILHGGTADSACHQGLPRSDIVLALVKGSCGHAAICFRLGDEYPNAVGQSPAASALVTPTASAATHHEQSRLSHLIRGEDRLGDSATASALSSLAATDIATAAAHVNTAILDVQGAGESRFLGHMGHMRS